MAGPNGIDILCDAVDAADASNLNVSSFLSYTDGFGASPPPPSHGQPAKRVHLSHDPTSPPVPGQPSNVCHICKRVYERADHLTRHMRSHENARQYQCSKCPKRFNRADLLTRHETTHSREAEGNGRPMIRRSERAAEACVNCSASKSKCDDQKPCGRCRSKNLICKAPARGSSQYRTLDDGLDLSPSDASTTLVTHMAPPHGNGGIISNHVYDLADHTGDVRPSIGGHLNTASVFADASYMPVVFPPESMMSNDDVMFLNPVNSFFPDLDFSAWNLNFDGFAIPQVRDSQGPSPQSSTATGVSKAGRSRNDPTVGHAAFKRSPWLWEPGHKDYVRRDQQGLHLNEEDIGSSPVFERLAPQDGFKMTVSTRDRLFAIVLAEQKDPLHVKSFPSPELLNYLLQAHFVHDDYQCDSWLHAASFNPNETIPELLAGLISHGASFIAVPAIWQFGLAMQEVVRLRLQDLFDSKNSNTRNLQCLQTFMLDLETGIWSGFKRKIEMAESFMQAMVTMLRRAGMFGASGDSKAVVPLASDSAEVLETKWNKFVARESFKRLALHVFLFDVQVSIALQKNPLIYFTELSFNLPASRDLWRASSAAAWRNIYLAKRPLPDDSPVPRISELIHRMGTLDVFGEVVDLDLCHAVMLHGFWGQVDAYREAVRFYVPRDIGDNGRFNGGRRNSTHQLWLTTQHKELYHELSNVSTLIQSIQHPGSTSASAGGMPNSRGVGHLVILAELLQMVMHVSLDDLQKFAGKSGEDEATRTSAYLEESWVFTSEARHAIWHAGQILGHARTMPPTSLRDFNAMAVYFASLTLWSYGLVSGRENDGSVAQDTHGDHERRAGGDGLIVLDGFETRETKTFLQYNRGSPVLSLTGDPQDGVEPLSNANAVLDMAIDLFRDNFPVRNEPLPPLVESVAKLLRDLGGGHPGSGPGRDSRAASDGP